MQCLPRPHRSTSLHQREGKLFDCLLHQRTMLIRHPFCYQRPINLVDICHHHIDQLKLSLATNYGSYSFPPCCMAVLRYFPYQEGGRSCISTSSALDMTPPLTSSPSSHHYLYSSNSHCPPPQKPYAHDNSIACWWCYCHPMLQTKMVCCCVATSPNCTSPASSSLSSLPCQLNIRCSEPSWPCSCPIPIGIPSRPWCCPCPCRPSQLSCSTPPSYICQTSMTWDWSISGSMHSSFAASPNCCHSFRQTYPHEIYIQQEAKGQGHGVEHCTGLNRLWLWPTHYLTLVTPGNVALVVHQHHCCCHALLPLPIDYILHLAELSSISSRLERDILLVKDQIWPLFVIAKIIHKMNALIHICECIVRHAFLQRHNGVSWASHQPTVVDQQKSLDWLALLTSKHVCNVVCQNDVSAVRVLPTRLPPLQHEVHHIRLHPCHQEIPKWFAVKSWQHPLKKNVVSYIAILVLHHLNLTIRQVHTKELVGSSIRDWLNWLP
jgi:hypothetical protein